MVEARDDEHIFRRLSLYGCSDRNLPG